jgi:hypothetical protein
LTGEVVELAKVDSNVAADLAARMPVISPFEELEGV